MQAPTNIPPFGLTLSLLADAPSSAHAAARQFCLDVIKEFYGFDYRPDWHHDLDTLLLPPAENHYGAANRGAFWTLCEPDGTLIATAGIRGLWWKPNLVQEFAARYPDPGKIGSLWRVYVRKDWRGRGLGKWLSFMAEDEAYWRGYTTMYLHASADAAATIAFWKSAGYANIGESGFSTHFDKPLDGHSLAAA